MIKVTELRIGNLVYAGTDEEDKPFPCRVDCILQYDVIIWSGNKTHLDYVDPIPLTPEWLEKCGFSYLKVDGIVSIGDFSDDEPVGDTHNWTLKVKANERQGGFDFEIVKWGDGPYTFVNQWLRIRIQYVHELQNIYHALTGSELIINMG